MTLLIISLLIYLLAKGNPRFYWLVLPIGLFFDFWRLNPLGYSGIKIIFFLFLYWRFVPSSKINQYKIT